MPLHLFSVDRNIKVAGAKQKKWAKHSRVSHECSLHPLTNNLKYLTLPVPEKGLVLRVVLALTVQITLC